MRDALTVIRAELRSAIGTKPFLYFPLARLAGREFLVEPDTDLVIEGYPRSGNSFAEAAFRIAQGGPVKIAHHLHVPAQVARAVAYGIPTVVVFRNPNDAISSVVHRRPGATKLSQAMRGYIKFHRGILPYKAGFVLARFETVTTKFGVVIDAVNERFDRQFGRFGSSTEEVREAYKMADTLALQRRGNRTVYSPDRGAEDLQERRAELAEVRKQMTSYPNERLHTMASQIYCELDAVADC